MKQHFPVFIYTDYEILIWYGNYILSQWSKQDYRYTGHLQYDIIIM